MKLRDIFLTANSNMLRSKLRTFLTVIAIFIGALTLSLTNSIGEGMSSYIDRQLANLGADDALIVRPAREDTAMSSKPQKYNPDRTLEANAAGIAIPVLGSRDLTAIRSENGIISAEPFLSASPEYITAGGEKYQTMLSPLIKGTRLDLAVGRAPSDTRTQNEIVLPVTFIGPLGLDSPEKAIGEPVQFGVRSPAGQLSQISATIVGVQNESISQTASVTANKALVQNLLAIQTAGLPAATTERYPAIIARFNPRISQEQLQKIQSSLAKKGYQALTVKDTIGIIKRMLDAIIIILNFFAGIALLAASFGIVNTLLMSVQERTKEIGLMKAMGMSSRKVFLLFSTEAVLLGFWGSLLGVLAANGIGHIANRIASNTFLKDLPGFQLTSFPWQSMLTIVLIIMAIAFLAGTLPARRAAQKDPIEALRYE
mgnify:CR=1 FL=1